MAKAVFFMLCCIVAALMVGVHGDCFAIAKAQAEATSQSEFSQAISEAYVDAIAQLTEGECTEAQAYAAAEAEALAISYAFVKVFTQTKATVQGSPGCIGTADAKALAHGDATASAIASAHAGAVAQVLGPYGAPLSIVFSQAKAATTALEKVMALAYSEASAEGVGIEDHDMDEDLQDAVAVALAEAFATACATYYCDS
eukprot:TRINITY_DN467_c0_g1_i4.p1 TRINITY_DN467_c0_g1~~TRINITY_DN467_c0_g1_i4.p1  ORF type:complete len:228 (+),score=41.91 TRINITY_DN467_c0_g1_i4:87-686(+)